MVVTKEIKEVIPQAPYVPIVTVSSQGEPHIIVVGKVQEVREEDTIVFGIYKMEKTQKNIQDTGKMQVIIASTQDGPKGCRLTGKACIDGKQVLFKAEKAEALL